MIQIAASPHASVESTTDPRTGPALAPASEPAADTSPRPASASALAPVAIGTGAWLAIIRDAICDVPFAADETLASLASGDPYAIVTLIAALRVRGFAFDVTSLLAHHRLGDLAAELDRRVAARSFTGRAPDAGGTAGRGGTGGAEFTGAAGGSTRVAVDAEPSPIVPSPQSFDGASLPFRFVPGVMPELDPGAGGEAAASAERSLDADQVSVLATVAAEHGPLEVQALLHAALAMALSRCCGQPAVLFASWIDGRWHDVSADLASNAPAELVAGFRDQLARCHRSGTDTAGTDTDPCADANGYRGAGGKAGASADGRPVSVVGLDVRMAMPRAADPFRPAPLSSSSRSSPYPAHPAESELPVTITALESGDGWQLSAQQSSAQGSAAAQPQRLLDYLARALDALADAQARAPAVPAIDIEILPQAERDAIEAFSTGPRARYSAGFAIAPWFERQVAATPDATAIVCGSEALSYAELNRRANRLAHLLVRRGATRGSRIGLCVSRGIGMVASQLAILKAGAAYVPLDPAFPAERLAFIADDADLALLVTDAASRSAPGRAGSDVIDLDDEREALEACSDADLPSGASSATGDDPAYVLHTSGSTGQPKGVVVTNRNVVNFIGAIQSRPGMQASDRLLAVTTPSFDIHVLELLAPLCTGACIVLADAQQVGSGPALQALIARHRVTVLQATPSTWSLLLDAGWRGTPGLRALIGGEPLTAEMAAQLLPRTAELWNMYGPTEATVWSHCWQVTDSCAEIAIGTPLANLVGRVVDAAGRICPVGVPGELWIGGDGVAAGYWRRPELTRERFVAGPGDSPGDAPRFYRTGDRVVWLAGGVLRHLGRIDHQVKVRGHRIEPGEIEAVMEAHPDVAQCICVVRADPAGEARLVAYLRCRQPVEAQALQAHAGRTLPVYMVPQHVVVLERLPLLPNGKIDRKALPEPAWAVRAGTLSEAPQGPVEEALARIWSEVLKVDAIGRADDFFALGGHSLAAMRVLARIEKTFGRKLRIASLFEAPTLWAQARLIDPDAPPEPARDSAVVPIQPGGSRPPIFFVSGYGGPILLLEKLARELGADQPLFLLDFAALTGDDETLTIEAAAGALIRHMRAQQPAGPYHLAGYSLGGPIVYEMGQQLVAAGEPVPMLAMLDRFAPGHPRLPALPRRLALHLRKAFHQGPRGALAYFSYVAHRTLRRLAGRAGLPVAEHMPDENAEIAGLNLDPATIRLGKASDRYVFRPYAGALMFIRVQDLGDRGIGTVEPDPVGGWHALAPGAQPIGVVPGTHTTLLFPEHSRELAKLLRRCVAIARDEVARGRSLDRSCLPAPLSPMGNGMRRSDEPHGTSTPDDTGRHEDHRKALQ